MSDEVEAPPSPSNEDRLRDLLDSDPALSLETAAAPPPRKRGRPPKVAAPPDDADDDSKSVASASSSKPRARPTARFASSLEVAKTPEDSERRSLLERLDRFAAGFPEKKIDPSKASKLTLQQLREYALMVESNLCGPMADDSGELTMWLINTLGSALEWVKPAWFRGVTRDLTANAKSIQLKLKVLRCKYGAYLSTEIQLLGDVGMTVFNVVQRNIAQNRLDAERNEIREQAMRRTAAVPVQPIRQGQPAPAVSRPAVAVAQPVVAIAEQPAVQPAAAAAEAPIAAPAAAEASE